ncbi:hypothetical protein CK203_045656 [Vitis vinifera]|uniref:Uncharacterized protein n=1 Tax=Vitis vinifera TaxID=29760 RepID=A0A438HQA2_VITVI|nr:hypothetical protein CK203_045656 [Vitis vinifera]
MDEGAKPTRQPQRRLNPHMYFQIKIDVEDQEKTTFTCPFGTYAYRRMPLDYATLLLPSKDACLASSVTWLNESWKSS